MSGPTTPGSTATPRLRSAAIVSCAVVAVLGAVAANTDGILRWVAIGLMVVLIGAAGALLGLSGVHREAVRERGTAWWLPSRDGSRP